MITEGEPKTVTELRARYAAARSRFNAALEPEAVSQVRRILLKPLPIVVGAPVPGYSVATMKRMDEERKNQLAKDAAELLAKEAAEWEMRARLHRLFPVPIEEIDPQPIRKPAKHIIDEVALKHGVSVTDMLSIRRDKPTVAARQEACYRLKVETTMSFPQIGRRMGGRDHTTALHSYRRQLQRIADGTAL